MSFSRRFQICFAALLLALLPGLALAGDEPRLSLSAQDVQQLMQNPGREQPDHEIESARPLQRTRCRGFSFSDGMQRRSS